MADITQSILCGIDVSQATLDIAQTDQPVIHLANSGEAIAEWMDSLSGRACFALEATGNYHELFLAHAVAAGHTVFLINGKQLNSYREAVGPRAKTDAHDARLLLRYLSRERDQLTPVKALEQQEKRLWSLLQRRATLVRAKSQLTLSLRGDADLQSMSQELMASLRRVIARIDQIMKQLGKALGWEDAIRRCQTIPGIGPLSAVALVTCFHRGEFTRSDKWIAYLGLDVRVRDSGKCKGRRKLSKRGNPELRRLLYNGAMSAVKMPGIRPRYEQYRARGLSSTAALVAMSRKLARIAFAVLSKDEVYDEKLSVWGCASP